MLRVDEKLYYTPKEYFALDEQSEERIEYYNGFIVVLKGGTNNHSFISGNIYNLLDNSFVENKSSSTPYISEMKLAIGKDKFYLYPDVMAVCGEVNYLTERKDILDNPVLIVEVLSDSTKGNDIADKFKDYNQVASLKEFLLISQDEPLVIFYNG